jgi:hypothetical protein
MASEAEVIEAMARNECRRQCTGQCAPICLSHPSAMTTKGRCPEAPRVFGAQATAALTALCATIPGLAEVLAGDARIVPVEKPQHWIVDMGFDDFELYNSVLTASPYRSKTDDL